jgi:hypothetical protein
MEDPNSAGWPTARHYFEKTLWKPHLPPLKIRGRGHSSGPCGERRLAWVCQLVQLRVSQVCSNQSPKNVSKQTFDLDMFLEISLDRSYNNHNFFFLNQIRLLYQSEQTKTHLSQGRMKPSVHSLAQPPNFIWKIRLWGQNWKQRRFTFARKRQDPHLIRSPSYPNPCFKKNIWKICCYNELEKKTFKAFRSGKRLLSK